MTVPSPSPFDFDEARFYRSSLASDPPSLHSRDSSTASDLSPTTPIFSISHSRIASTSSSISCSPDARNHVLDDLPEHDEDDEVEVDEYDLADVPETRFKAPVLRQKATPTTALCTSSARSSRPPSRKPSEDRSEPVDIAPRSETNLEPDTEDGGLATTPLLPPAMLLLERRDSDAPSIQSPLQSPTVAELSRPTSVTASPVHPSRTNRESSIIPAADIPSLDIEEPDEWSVKLGHANYHITPEPYMPERCDKAACQQLTADWDAARRQYLEHAEHVSEHYGPTSQTFKLTEQKWASIDALWKAYHAAATKRVVPDVPMFEDHTTIVGPMVQYPAKTQPKPSRRASVIKYLDRLAGR